MQTTMIFSVKNLRSTTLILKSVFPQIWIYNKFEKNIRKLGNLNTKDKTVVLLSYLCFEIKESCNYDITCFHCGLISHLHRKSMHRSVSFWLKCFEEEKKLFQVISFSCEIYLNFWPNKEILCFCCCSSVSFWTLFELSFFKTIFLHQFDFSSQNETS